MQFSSRSVFLPLRSKYPPVLTFSLCSSLKVRDQVSHPNSITGKITVVLIYSSRPKYFISLYVVFNLVWWVKEPLEITKLIFLRIIMNSVTITTNQQQSWRHNTWPQAVSMSSEFLNLTQECTLCYIIESWHMSNGLTICLQLMACKSESTTTLIS
jgi:hypothetical protein